MSKLKARLAYFSEDDYDKGAHKICAKVSDCGYDRRNEWWSYAFKDEVYIKSEADKVIADLEDELQAANEQVENLINNASSIMLFQDRVNDNKCDELRHNKFKRCLAMARWCETNVYNIRRKPLCDMDDHEGWQHDDEFWQRWNKRWLELAEKFKEAK